MAIQCQESNTMPALLNGVPFLLTHLFKAEFADGTLIEQTLDDTSIIDPAKRSAFYDVLQKAQESPLLRFLLQGDGHAYLVDLTDGHFEIDGVSFEMHETLPTDFLDREIIFYRKHQHDFNSNSDGSMGAETDHRIWYCIGWQATINGKNFKETLTIKG